MMKEANYILFAKLILMWFVLVPAAEEVSVLEQFLVPFRRFRMTSIAHLKNYAESEENIRKLLSLHKLQDVTPKHHPFPCDVRETRSNQVPTSVHKLRPGDIDVIGALGDSLTAGFGLSATNLPSLFFEERGKSFSIGGEGSWRNYLTLPNILKEFNPNLIGYSLKSSLSIDRASQFNVAEGGAISTNTPYMSKILIKRIKADKRVDLKNHWKMITLLIGNNDFCSEICYNSQPEILLNKHKFDLIQVLRNLRDNLPRTIVNVIPPPHLKILVDMVDKPPECQLAHSYACPCIVGEQFKKYRKYFYEIMRKWQAIDIEVSNYAEFDREDFTVIPQVYIVNYKFPLNSRGTIDYSYLSYDCFHLSQKGNARLAADLWNSIMDPISNKSTEGYGGQPLKCPTQRHPYIYTRRNSL